MPPQTPLLILSGPLGSGKTTLLQHIIRSSTQRLALLINEFGEIGIDGKLVKGKNLEIKELEGGCVCCSLIGEFEAAVEEIIETIAPEAIVVEATGVAEPDALVFDVSEMLPAIRMDGAITVMDADAMVAFPDLGPTIRTQVTAADLLLLNKIDLVTTEQQESLKVKLRTLNPQAPIIPATYCQIDTSLLFGLTHHQTIHSPTHRHQLEYESFTYHPKRPFQQNCFESIIKKFGPTVYRAKGFVPFAQRTCLFNYVNGRWQLEPVPEKEETSCLVFIGQGLKSNESQLIRLLQSCEL